MKPPKFHFLRLLFYAILVRPLLIFMLGFNVRNARKLKYQGAHIIAANHNSHLDTMVLMSLFPLRELHKIRIVAAKDYFCRTPALEWFSVNIIGIIPLDRKGGSKNVLEPVIKALDEGYTVILFPEGSRGAPEKKAPLKFGIAKLLQQKNEITVTPVFMHGLGKALPRGEALFVPFICDINIGEPLSWQGDRVDFMKSLDDAYETLAKELNLKPWE